MAPLLMAVFVGAVGAFDATRALRDASYTAGTVSDLVTRFIEFDDQRRDEMFTVADSLLDTFDEGSSYEMSITSVLSVPNPDAGLDPNNVGPDDEPVLEVQWSEATDISEVLTTADLSGLDLPRIDANESIIVIRLTGTYTPIISGFGLPVSLDVERQAVRRPRFVNSITYLSPSSAP